RPSGTTDSGLARSAARQQGEDAADQLFVVGHIVRENPHLLYFSEVEGLARRPRRPRREGKRLEAGPTGLGLVRHEHEVEVGPLAARHLEEGPLTPLTLDGEELSDVRVVLHLDEEILGAPPPRRGRPPPGASPRRRGRNRRGPPAAPPRASGGTD